MLRPTEFFRSIECPFYGGAGGGCNRPYCHFRHRNQKPREKPPGDEPPLAADREPGYDPYNPELPKGSSRNGEGISGDLTESSTLELELVNKAIEAVKNEVEREQEKLSRYEDLLDAEEEYVLSTSSTQKAVSKIKNCAEILPNEEKLIDSLEYNPNNYQLNSNVEYTPTPLSVTASSSKYTLDTDDEGDARGNSLKYVPTLVTKPVKNATSVSGNKYVIDDTKPCTDLEYDPLLNYSARLIKKKTKEHGTKRPRGNTLEEPYIPTTKKRCHRLKSSSYDTEFPDSGDELSNNHQQGYGESKSDLLSLKAKNLNEQSAKEIAIQYDDDDVCKLDSKKEDRRKQKLKSSSQSSKTSHCSKEELERECKGKKDKGSDPDGSKVKARKDKIDSIKSKSSHHPQKDGKKGKIKCAKESLEIKQEKQREKLKDSKNGDNTFVDKKHKGSEKNETKEEKQKIKTDGSPSRKMGKAKMSKLDGVKNENQSKSRSNSLSDSSGKVKCPDGKLITSLKSDKNNNNTKSKALIPKNGTRVDSKIKGKDSKSVKDKVKHQEKKLKPALTKRTLSHTDLFGDDSSNDESTGKPDTAVNYESNSDTDRNPHINSSSSEDETGGNIEQAAFSSDDDIDCLSLEKDFEFESDPMEECLRIFNESKEVKNEDKGRISKQIALETKEEKESSLTTLFPGQKRRISHISKQENVEPAKPVIRPFRRLTAQEVCYQRSLMAQQQAVQLAEVEKSVSVSFINRGKKQRIAHKPKAEVISSANQSPVKQNAEPIKRTICPNSPRNSTLGLKAQTTVGMASKTVSTIAQKRIAHTPTLKSSLKRPTIPTEYGSKVPTNVRQRYLNVFIDECLKICGSEQMAYDKALSEENTVYQRSTSRTVYLNVAVNTLKKLRSQSDAISSPTRKTSNVSTNKKMQSHETLLGGKLAMKTSFTLNRSGKQEDVKLKGAVLYNRLSEYILTEEQLQENCYPRPHPEKPGVAVIFNQNEKKNNIDPSIRICCRCGAEYAVSVSGNCIRKEECNYHWGRMRRQKVPGGWETQYNCCGGAVGSPGCQTAKQHVQDGRKENLAGFMKTFEKAMPPDENPGIFALDCEMCYTKQGLELSRLTVVDSDLKVVYDTFVKPDNKVIDYNTRFSGVTEEDMASTTITIRDVQAVLLNMFSAATILIGHSLESDLFALKLIHSTVIDTAIVFPHRLGLPYKRALKNLMADYLKRIIQDNVEGHDSSEDASACMELMIWRLKEDAKLRR
ncbi:RNA exonuclease 1 homolog isoform X2 [Pristis pectinata]|uniref:RNA exonuclease 1 homolog isoform X2 n=1 Tax=Pristis pectinata TaxID=685728 RepID=UPI00223D9DB6|nr:RNA exonuclease 1 homolog isoform X2 [Pristis pectinata]